MCCFLFLSIFLIVSYLSIRKNKRDKNKLEDKLTTQVCSFVNSLYQNYNVEPGGLDFREYIETWISSQSQNNAPHIALMTYILVNYPQYFNQYKDLSEAQRKYQVSAISVSFIHSGKQLSLHYPTTQESFWIFVLNFCAMFGSVAGCSAGLLNLVSGMGASVGGGALPFLGGLVFVVAVGMGIYGGLRGLLSNRESHAMSHFEKDLKSINCKLNQQVHLGAGRELQEVVVTAQSASGSLFASPSLKPHDGVIQPATNGINTLSTI